MAEGGATLEPGDAPPNPRLASDGGTILDDSQMANWLAEQEGKFQSILPPVKGLEQFWMSILKRPMVDGEDPLFTQEIVDALNAAAKDPMFELPPQYSRTREITTELTKEEEILAKGFVSEFTKLTPPAVWSELRHSVDCILLAAHNLKMPPPTFEGPQGGRARPNCMVSMEITRKIIEEGHCECSCPAAYIYYVYRQFIRWMIVSCRGKKILPFKPAELAMLFRIQVANVQASVLDVEMMDSHGRECTTNKQRYFQQLDAELREVKKIVQDKVSKIQPSEDQRDTDAANVVEIKNQIASCQQSKEDHRQRIIFLAGEEIKLKWSCLDIHRQIRKYDPEYPDLDRSLMDEDYGHQPQNMSEELPDTLDQSDSLVSDIIPVFVNPESEIK